MVKPELVFDGDSSLFVAPGLYVLRYKSGGDKIDPPTAVVLPAQGSEADIEIISTPGCASGRLERPGAALLIRAADHGRLRIGIKRNGSNGSLDAKFKLESVGSFSTASKQEEGGQRPRAEDEPAVSPVIAAAASRGLSNALFLAHISRRGDVWVTAGEWAAGPDAPGQSKDWSFDPPRRRESAPRFRCWRRARTRNGPTGSERACLPGAVDKTDRSRAYGSDWREMRRIASSSMPTRFFSVRRS